MRLSDLAEIIAAAGPERVVHAYPGDGNLVLAVVVDGAMNRATVDVLYRLLADLNRRSGVDPK